MSEARVRRISRDWAVRRRADLLAVAWSTSDLDEAELRIDGAHWALGPGLRAILTELDELDFLFGGVSRPCHQCLDDGLCVLHDGHEEPHKHIEEWWRS